MTDSRTFDARIQLVEYAPSVLDAPPGTSCGSIPSTIPPGLETIMAALQAAE